jgi:hypothetical protein
MTEERGGEPHAGADESLVQGGDVGRCPSCGAKRVGPYCAECGQRFLDGRHSLANLAGGVVERLASLEHGLVHTLVRLAADPGVVIRDYLAGRTIMYVHPFAYMIVGFGVFALAWDWMGGVGGDMERWLLGVLVVFLAAASRLVFWRAGMNYAEHLILNMFLYAQAVLFLTAGMVIAGTLPAVTRRAAGIVVLAGVCGYLMWAYSRVFRRRRLLSALGGLVVLLGGTAVWAVATLAVVQFVRD